MRDRGRGGVRFGFLCGVLGSSTLGGVRSDVAGNSQVMPGNERTRSGAEEALEAIAHVGVGARVGDEDGVVSVPALLPPGVEDDLLPGVIRMNGGDDTVAGVVEQHAADADLLRELEA